MKHFLVILLSLSVLAANTQNDTDRLHVTTVISPDSTIQKNISTQRTLTFKGQATSWGLVQFDNPVNSQLGGRFIPTLLGDFSLSKNSKLDFETSLHINGSLNWSGTRSDTTMYALKPYRVWLRYSGENWEVRGGLQKINFGSAKIFRPLMWFDQMDVRDPLQLTNGVYGMLGKYFFPNNANIWLWSLIGNKNPKGYEMLGSSQWIPEVGGRIETPAGPGELAFSTHFRKVEISTYLNVNPEKQKINESRFGLDGKWDIGPGVWLETSLSIFEKNSFSINRFQNMLNLGADYTFPIGSGLNVSAEYFRFHVGEKIWDQGITANIFSGMMTYPISILDNISAVFFYLKEAEKWFNYVSCARSYDKWSFYLIGFWNPEINLPIAGNLQGKNLFMGKGAQVMVSYDF